MKARLGVIVMTLALALYLVLVAQRAWIMLGTGEPVGIAMGVALVILPVIAVWGIARELFFGRDAEKLGAQLDAEGALPEDP